MRTLVNDIKNIGLAGAISNAVVGSYYDAKANYAVTSREIKSTMRNMIDVLEEKEEDFEE